MGTTRQQRLMPLAETQDWVRSNPGRVEGFPTRSFNVLNYKMVKKTTQFFLWFFVVLLIFELGLRGLGWMLLKQRDAGFDRSGDVYTILCLGESTTMLGGKDSYPSQLEGILQERFPGRNIQVINKGLAGKNTDHILEGLPGLLRTYKPLLVIVMMGINDDGRFLKELTQQQNHFWKKINSLCVVRLAFLVKHWIFKEEVWSHGKKDAEISKTQKQAEQEPPTNLSGVSLQYQKVMIMALAYFGNKDYAKAEKLLRYLLEKQECPDCTFRVWHDLVVALYEQGKFNEMILEMPKSPYWAYEELHFMDLCRKPEYFDQAVGYILEHTRYDPQVTFYYDKAADCYEFADDEQNAKKLREQATAVRQKYFNQQTRKNYVKLHCILKKSGIRALYVQYPLSDVRTLKSLLMDEPDYRQMIFVDNEEVFRNLVKKNGYNEYFSDRFAGFFGHCTKEGNRVLAQNIANTIVKKNIIF